VDVDPNEGRRKRQRNATPEDSSADSRDIQPSSWEDQLKAAADISHPSFQHQLNREAADDSDSDEAEANGIGGSTEHGVGEGSSEARPLLSPGGDGAQENEARPNTALKSKKPHTPSKKMLKVRADGRLASPKSTATAQGPRPKRQRKSSVANAFPRTNLIVVLRYGSDRSSRTSIGDRIDLILSGLTSRAATTASANEKHSKVIEPPKATHPFFTRGAVRPSVQPAATLTNVAVTTAMDHGTTTQKNSLSSPRKSRITSKPAEYANRCIPALGIGLPNFGSDSARVTKFPGAQEPIWPPSGMLHIGRPDDTPSDSALEGIFSQTLETGRKLKDLQVQIAADEEVLNYYKDLVQSYQTIGTASRNRRDFRCPRRLVMTGLDLQLAVRKNISHTLPKTITTEDKDEEDELSDSHSPNAAAHAALRHTYAQIALSRTAFDTFTSETQNWVHRYAPKSANHVLQQGRDVALLKDWLKSLTVSSVVSQADTTRSRDSSVPSKRRGDKAIKRKRKRGDDLDDFVISSEEEVGQLAEITDQEDTDQTRSPARKSMIRAGGRNDSDNALRATNAVIISGPHGCGKTAAVYAVAHELGFEIFEINAGSRRSGKDILDKVGDMTRNHLVQHREEFGASDAECLAEDVERVNNQLQEDLQSGRQGTMKSFFQSKGKAMKEPSPKKRRANAIGTAAKVPQARSKSRKQSLILLEEVDILFEEDKAFWATTLGLIVKSKRPVIMTCTDESLLPLDDMAVHAIFRLTPPSEQLATDYLILVACNEGHLLERDAVSALFNAKSHDLRASLTELNFFCQMAIGDRKGGLEWMLIDPSATAPHEQAGKHLRVVSEGTYCKGMGWLSGEAPYTGTESTLDQETGLLSQVYNGWNIDIAARQVLHQTSVMPKQSGQSRADNLSRLREADQMLETFSGVDTFPSCATREENEQPLDATQPDFTEKMRCNYIEGSVLLQADSITETTDATSSPAHTMRACAIRLAQKSERQDGYYLTEQKTIEAIPQIVQLSHAERSLTNSSFSAAFDAIAKPSKSLFGISRAAQISCFDSTMSVITEDLGPYVRSIVSYDLRLEEQRRQLSSLLSQPGNDGRKTRTTRASRAALEGGNKASTRRERWFPKDTNFNLVLQTGGVGWQDVAWERLAAMTEILGEGEVQDGSRRSSLATATGSET